MQALIEAAKRLDELSTARVISDLAELAHKAQKNGQPLGSIHPRSITVSASGVKLDPGAEDVGYSAPERLRGQTGDRRSDVFSLGVVLWEALAHARLFEGVTDELRRKAVLELAVGPPSEHNANIPAELDAICKKALARDPVDRYQSLKVMAAEISAVLDDAGYPEGNELIAKYLDQQFPRGAAIAAKLAAASTSSGPMPRPNPSQTVLGLAPLKAGPAQTAVEASASPSEPSRGKPATVPPVIPSIPSSLPTPAAGNDASRAKPATVPPPSAAEPGRSKPATVPPSAYATQMGPAPAAIPGLTPATAPAATANAPIIPATLSATATAPGVGSSVLVPPAPAESPAPIEKVAAASAATSAEPSGPTVAPTSSAANAGSPASTQILGSLSGIPIVPAPPVLPSSGSGPIVAPSAASAPVVQPADVAAKPSITTAETIETPSISTGTTNDAVPRTPTSESPSGVVGLPPVPPGASVGATSAPAPAAASRASTPAVDPTAAVSLPKPRAQTRPGTDGGGGRDVLAGWGWSTDSHTAIDDGYEEDSERASRKRLIKAIGGALLALVALIIVASIAFGGDDDAKPPEQPAGATDGPSRTAAAPDPSAAPTPSPTAPTEPTPATPPSATDTPEPVAVAPPAPPTTTEPPKPEPTAPAAVVEPPKPEPPQVAAPPKPEPPKAEPPKVEPKPEPPKVAVAAPPKPEPPKPEPKARDRRGDRKTVAAAKPVDPYAATAAPKVKSDPAAAYKTGFQQYVRGDNAGALETFRNSLTTDPKYAPTWRGLGLVYEKMGQAAQAKKMFNRYLQLSPKAPDADQIRARLEKL